MPEDPRSDTPLLVLLAIRDAEIGSRIVVSEAIPDGARVLRSSVAGAKLLETFTDDGMIVWVVLAEQEIPVVTYELEFDNPAAVTFASLWAAQDGTHGFAEERVAVIAPPVLEMPRPNRAPPENLWPYVLAIIAISCAGLVYVVETSERHAYRLPFGQRSLSFLQLQFAQWRKSIGVALRAASTPEFPGQAVTRKRTSLVALAALARGIAAGLMLSGRQVGSRLARVADAIESRFDPQTAPSDEEVGRRDDV
jgi:hypothetical protein